MIFFWCSLSLYTLSPSYRIVYNQKLSSWLIFPKKKNENINNIHVLCSGQRKPFYIPAVYGEKIFESF